MNIRPYITNDWPALWAILEPTFRAGDTYAYARDISAEEARAAWVGATQACWVAELEGRLVGTYYVKPNQPGQGAHVCNAGYVVCSSTRGQGVAGALCTHSQAEALRLGYRAMQFNLVVSSNTVALGLWQKLGFSVVGRLPGAFCHPQHGDIDACVLYKRLDGA
jgi:L-amino acid N-acyltransferase YncA